MVSSSFFSSPQQKREEYLEKEAELIKLALCSKEEQLSLPLVETFDTRIPSATCTPGAYCRVDGSCSHYNIHGIRIKSVQDPEGTKETAPVVLLHGYGNSGAFFYRSWMELSKHFTTVYALDWLGFGASSRPIFSAHTTTQAEDFFVESLEAWRQAIMIDAMILVGHSLGGYLAVAYCERYPHVVKHLFLLSPVGIPHETQDILDKRMSRRKSSITYRFWYTIMKHVSPYVTFGHVARSLLPFIVHHWLLPRYIERFATTVPDVDERMLLAQAGYRSALLPGSGEHALLCILNTFAYARQPLMDRIPKLQSLQSCCMYYGDRDWMDSSAGIAVKNKSQHDVVKVYHVRNSGHMILVENPIEFVNGMVHQLFPPGRLRPDDDPLPIEQC